jgi:uncharacterized membrane protein YkvA (DUF1232 family)
MPFATHDGIRIHMAGDSSPPPDPTEQRNLAALLKGQAGRLKADTLALYIAARDPRTPWYAKLLVAAIVAYALSPIDLIPDFVPVLGYLDDLVLIPAGIALAIRLIPRPLLDDCRAQARDRMQDGKPVSRAAAVVIVGLWVVAVALCVVWVFRTLGARRS